MTKTERPLGELAPDANKMDREANRAAMVAMHADEVASYARRLVRQLERERPVKTVADKPLKVVAIWTWEARLNKWVRQDCNATYSSMDEESLRALWGKEVKTHPDKPGMLFLMRESIRVCYEVMP